jgi:hypothetical protein
MQRKNCHDGTLRRKRPEKCGGISNAGAEQPEKCAWNESFEILPIIWIPRVNPGTIKRRIQKTHEFSVTYNYMEMKRL